MTRPPGEGRATPVVTEGEGWAGRPPYDTVENFVAHIARHSTPVREYVDGEFRPWIARPLSRGGSDLAGAGTPRVAETPSAPTGTPDLPPEATASPARSVTPAGAG